MDAPQKTQKPQKPTRIMFCGGGSRCILFIQALVELEKVGYLTDVHEYWGTSAGALIALILSIGLGPTAIQPILQGTQFHKFRDMDIRNLLSFQTSWGLDNGTSLEKEIERLVSLLASSDILLKDVPSLHVVVTDVTARETLVVSGATHPHLRAVDAVRASMSLPFFYRPYKEPLSGHYWNDGALRANFAWDLLPSDEERNKTLGFCFIHTPVPSMTLERYLFSMIHFDEPRKLKKYADLWSHRILWFTHPPFPAWYTRIDVEDIRLLNAAGSKVALDWIQRFLTQPLPSETQESPPWSAPPRTLPLLSHPDSAVGSSGIPESLALSRQEYPSPLSYRSERLSRRWSV